MGFLDKLFGAKKEPVPDVTTILTLDECAVFLDEKSAQEFARLLKIMAPRFNEIKAIQAELARQLKEFRSRNLELEEGHTRLRKIVESSKRGFLGAMDLLLQKTQPPENPDFESIRAYALHARLLLEKEIVAFSKSIAYTGVVMKREVKDVGRTLTEFQSVLLDLNQRVASSPLTAVAEARQRLDGIRSLLLERKAVSERAASLKAQLAELAAKARDTAAELAQLKASPEIPELEGLLDRREKLAARQKDLKNRLLGMLAYVDRPLRRFLKLVQSGHYTLDKRQEKILDRYLENPFEAIKEDPEAKALKQLLAGLQPLLESDQVGLKDDRERERRLASLRELLAYDFFTEIFSKFNALEAELAGLSQRINQIKLGEQISNREKWIQGIHERFEALSRELAAETQALAANEAQTMQAKEAIERTVLDALRHRIVIKPD